jgi:hypothetical protein
MTTDAEIEQQIQDKRLTAPRVTPEHIESVIVGEYYFTAAQGANTHGPIEPADLASLQCLTICVLVLKNGFTVSGESACASPANFDWEIGKAVALRNAMSKIWPLEGYLLKSKLSA